MKLTLEKFETKNTATSDRLVCTLKQAIETAKRLSFEYHKVILSSNTGFETYEQGETTEWSYPNGLGQIKANS